MKKLYILLSLMIMLACAGCAAIDIATDNSIGENDENTTPISTDITEKQDEKKINDTIYASDEVVNRFITEFNHSSKFEMNDISEGNIRTKFFAHANDCYLEITNANDAVANSFCVSVNGGKEVEERDKMFEVVVDVIKVLEPTITDETITQTVEFLKNEQYMVNNYSISDNLIIETYVPIVELSYGKSDCRVDIASLNYK